MRTLKLDTLSFIASPNEKKFILLRSEKADNPEFLESFAVPKVLNRNEANKIPGVWGTLGYANNKPIDWSGELQCSNEGNDDFESNSTVEDEVKLLTQMYPELVIKGDVKEKFINLSDLEIPYDDVFSLEELPKLRMDVFLGPDEGALAFYQYQIENNENAELDYILPEATVGNNTDQRDRLTYLFNVIPQKSIEPVPDIPNRYRLSTKIKNEQFIVKVLIFKRAFRKSKEKNLPSTSKEIVELIEEELATYKSGLFVKDHKLLIMDRNTGKFHNAIRGAIDTSQKTLLLLHGTFASTKGSFGEVYSWIHNFLKENKYDQVIAFDHPTFFLDAEQNIKKMHQILNELDVQAFDKEVDIIGTSQGGLLAQYLANSKQDSIRVGKVALVASANGVGYLSFAEGMAFGFKMLRKVMIRMGLAPVAFVAALLQHSFKWVIDQPGMAVMKPGHEELNKIIYNTPTFETTKYYPVAGNYDNDGWFKRKLEVGIDLILSKYNDWVVSTKNQFTLPSKYVAIDGYNPGKYKDYMINDALHGSLIEIDECQNRIEGFFFTQEAEKVDYNKLKSTDHFDAHCHLFGRNVITGRLILMLLGDIVDYFKEDHPDERLEPIDLREDNHEGHGIGAVIRNIFKYFLFNKGAHQMLHDLEEDYLDQKTQTFRYIPLMFDLEMTFRNEYDLNNAPSMIEEKMNEFKEKHDSFLTKMDEVVDRFENNNELVFNGTRVVNEDSVKILKYAKTILKGLNLINAHVLKDAQDSYGTQKEEMKQLKNIYGNDIFPFIAVDPRREGVAEDIETYIVKDKTFHGVKIYSPNGYSPTDLNLFDPNQKFVHGTSLYKWCEDNGIPIMAHCSDSGFGTFTKRLQVYGDVCTQVEDTSNNKYTYQLEFKDKEYIDFEHNILDGGFGKSVKERAHRLNHPTLWRKVLERYPNLKICLAHFGGGSHEWQDEIKRLILDFDHVYTDLSCQTDPDMLKTIAERYFETDTEENKKIRSRIMYGSDYFLNMLQGIRFKNYYGNFKDAFSEEEVEYMSVGVVKEYLGIEN